MSFGKFTTVENCAKHREKAIKAGVIEVLITWVSNKHPPCIRLAGGKFELTNQDSAGGKKLLSSRQCKLTAKALKSGNFSHWRWHVIFTKED